MKPPTETCYKCNAPATSREHVPPISLFPEQKDFRGVDFRKNLITVPSCDLHNSKKSKDDEFLMASLAGVVGNNAIGFIQTHTKVKRAFERTGEKLLADVLKSSSPLTLHNKKGDTFPVLIGNPDIDRLKKCFEHIACGLYFLEYGQTFNGDCSILIGFITYTETNMEKLKTLCQKLFAIQAVSSPVKGANPEIFNYQFGPTDKDGLIPLKLTFYQGADVYITFKAEHLPMPFNIGLALLDAGKRTVIDLGNGEKMEFN